MSADDTIAIGVFPTKDGGKEYRVIHAQAIENCDFGDAEYQDNSRFLYYGEAESIQTEETANAEANRFYNEVVEDFGYCEYGIQIFEYERPLPDKTLEQAKAFEEEYWVKYRADQAAKEEERERNTKVYYILAPVRVVEYQGVAQALGMTPEKIKEYSREYGAYPSEQAAATQLENWTV